MRKLARARYGTIGGLLLVVAGAAILMGIITAEALYPAADNTHIRNTISDLGAMRPLGILIRQPSAAIFGLDHDHDRDPVIAAACFLYRALSRWGTTIPVALLGAGILGVGIFPETTSQHTSLSRKPAFTAGSAAAILSWRVQASPLRYASLLLGAAALASLAVGGLL